MFLMSDPQTSVINPVKHFLAGSKEHTATAKFVFKDQHITCLHHMLHVFHEFGKHQSFHCVANICHSDLVLMSLKDLKLKLSKLQKHSEGCSRQSESSH